MYNKPFQTDASHRYIVRNFRGEHEYMNKCLVCKKEIPSNHVCLVGLNGSVCMGCEFKKIDVWHITLADAHGNGYYDTDISHIIDMLNECDYGDGYTIKKEKMNAMMYYNLSEFVGF